MTDNEEERPLEIFPRWHVDIERAENGFIVRCPNESVEVFEDSYVWCPDDEDRPLEALRKALYEAGRRLGCDYNSRRKHNLDINLDRKGHKVEG